MTPHDLGGGLGGACRPPSFGAEGVGRNKAAVNLLLSGSVASDAVTDPKAALALHSRIMVAVRAVRKIGKPAGGKVRGEDGRQGEKGLGCGCVVRWCGAGQGRHKRAPLLTPETNGGPYRLADGAIIGRGFMACWRADKRIWCHIEIMKRA